MPSTWRCGAGTVPNPRWPGAGSSFGCGQYTSREFAAVCAELGVTQSMGGRAPVRTTPTPSVNAALKRETLQGARRYDGPRACRLTSSAGSPDTTPHDGTRQPHRRPRSTTSTHQLPLHLLPTDTNRCPLLRGKPPHPCPWRADTAQARAGQPRAGADPASVTGGRSPGARPGCVDHSSRGTGTTEAGEGAARLRLSGLSNTIVVPCRGASHASRGPAAAVVTTAMTTISE